MSRFQPDMMAESVLQIDPQTLVRRGVLWLAVDVDNTLAPPNGPELNQKISDWLRGVREAGLPVVLVSNNSKKRVSSFAKLCGLPYVSRAMKPLGRGLVKAAKISGFPLTKGALIGDQLFTDIFAARRRGMLAIFVHPMTEDHGRFFSVKRRLERMIRARQAKKEI